MSDSGADRRTMLRHVVNVNRERNYVEDARRGRSRLGIQLILWANGTCSVCRVTVQLHLKTKHNTQSIQDKKSLGSNLIQGYNRSLHQAFGYLVTHFGFVKIQGVSFHLSLRTGPVLHRKLASVSNLHDLEALLWGKKVR